MWYRSEKRIMGVPYLHFKLDINQADNPLVEIWRNGPREAVNLEMVLRREKDSSDIRLEVYYVPHRSSYRPNGCFGRLEYRREGEFYSILENHATVARIMKNIPLTEEDDCPAPGELGIGDMNYVGGSIFGFRYKAFFNSVVSEVIRRTQDWIEFPDHKEGL